jgi:hypothetical protein
MDKQKLIHQLFIGKVSEIIGQEKAIELLREAKTAIETTEPQLPLGDDIKNKWLTLSEDEKNIMGRPNFACGKIAHRMRDMGFEVATTAEEEQALVIWAMLEFYKEYGKGWSDKMNGFLKNG